MFLFKKIILRDSQFFKGFTEENVKNTINSINYCCKGLGAIEDILQSYKEDVDYIKKTESLNFTIENIERELGYKVFLNLYGITFIPDKDDNSEQSYYVKNSIAPLFKVIVSMPDKLEPSFPWGDSLNSYLYIKEVEENYQLLTEEVKTQQVSLGNKQYFRNIQLSSLHQGVLAKMQNPTFSVRASEIYSLYVSLLIADDMDLKFIDNFVEADFTPNYEYNTFIHVKKLFNEYYEKIKNQLTPELSINDPIWGELLEKIDYMGARIRYIKNFYGDKLAKLLSENKIDQICHEIDRFMKMNFEDRKIIPTKKEIEDSKIKGGPKLIKKILAGDGDDKKGFEYFRDQYSLFLSRQIEFISGDKDDIEMTAPNLNPFAQKYRDFNKRTENEISKIIQNLNLDDDYFEINIPEEILPSKKTRDSLKIQKSDLEISKNSSKKLKIDDKNDSKTPRFKLVNNESPNPLQAPFNFLIKDNSNNEIIGVISSPSRNLLSSNFQTQIQELGKTLLAGKSPNLNINSKVVIVCDFNPSDKEVKKAIKLIKNHLKNFGIKNIFLISIIKIDSLIDILNKKII